MLSDRIINRKAKISVVGLGYVGLPLVNAITKSGFKVFGVDLSPEKIKTLQDHKSYIPAVSDKEIKCIIENEQFVPGHDFNVISESDIIIICVPTPLSKNGEPDLSFIEDATNSIAQHLRKDSLVVLESTTYPGTTKELINPILKRSKLIFGEEYFLAYSPEREDPGNKEYSTSSIPKVVGGVCEKSTELSLLFYSLVVSMVYPVSSSEIAEAVKLYENTYRLINISWVNEMKIVFSEMGIDIWEVIDAAKTKPFGFTPFYPGPGIGGHCIPIDPYYLTWKAREYGVSTNFIETARHLKNISLSYIINKICYAMDETHHRGMKESKILLLGMSYKKDISDTRESPAIEIFSKLLERKSDIDYYDPYAKKVEIVHEGKKITKKSIDIQNIDYSKYHAVILLTDHSNIDYKEIASRSTLFIDTKNTLPKNIPNVIRI